MPEFSAKHEDKIAGTLPGFDRLVFRGTLRSIAHEEGMKRYLWANEILLKDFGPHVERVSRRLKEASLAEAQALGRPVKYLTSSQVSKEAIARGIAVKEGIRDGLVCVLTCVEPCGSFEIHRNRDTQKLELERRFRKCLFLYHYWMHPVFGCMHARIQSWFPFAADSVRLEAIRRGEFALHGFRNRGLRAIFFPRVPHAPEEARRRSAWVSRKLRLLRALGLITKITGTHRYQLTLSERKALTAILTALRATVRQLTPLAA